MIADSGLLIDFWRRKQSARAFLAAHETELVVPFVVVAELQAGALRAANPQAEERKVMETLAAFPVAWPDHQTLRHFANLKHTVEQTGKPIGVHDLWIAAIAQQYNVPVATNDAHFQRIPELKLVSW